MRSEIFTRPFAQLVDPRRADLNGYGSVDIPPAVCVDPTSDSSMPSGLYRGGALDSTWTTSRAATSKRDLADMQAPLQQLLERIRDSLDESCEQDADLQLAMFLEFKNRPVNMPSDPGFYQREVPDQLRSLTLTDDDQLELLRELQGLILSAPSEPKRIALLSALGLAAPPLGIGPALSLLFSGYPEFSDEELRQVLVALMLMLDLPPTHESYEEFAKEIRERDPRPVLDELATRSNVRIAETAQSVRRGVQRVFEA
jgi:hypothetical protein